MKLQFLLIVIVYAKYYVLSTAQQNFREIKAEISLIYFGNIMYIIQAKMSRSLRERHGLT